MTRRPTLASLPALLVCAAVFAGFGALRYHWVQHEVAWHPAISAGRYVLPAAILIGLLVLGAAPRSPSHRPLWLIALGGIALAGLQVWLKPAAPWLLYAWTAWVIAAVSRMATPLQPPRPSTGRLWIVLLAATAAMVLLHIDMQLDLWNNLSFGYHDIGLFARALHNAAAGRGLFVDSLDRSILAEHAFFALWLLVPLCHVVAPFNLLVALSAICLSGSALIVAWYARRRFHSNGAACLAALAWLMLPMHGCLVIAQGYGFHAMYMAVPVLLFGLSLGCLGRWRAAAVVLLLCMAVREDIALTVAAWGAYVFFVPRRRALGAGVVLLALAYLALSVFVVIPHYRGSAYPHLSFHFQGDLSSRLTSLWSADLSFLMTLLLPLALLPLLNWRFALIAAPAIAETLMTQNAELHNICFQYYVPAMPVLYIAAVEAWRNQAGPVQPRHPDLEPKPKLESAWALLAAAMLTQAYLGVGRLSNNPARPYAHETLQADAEHVAQMRRAGIGTVTASYRIAAHFLDARRLWTTTNADLGETVIVHDADVIAEERPREALIRARRAGGYHALFANYHLVVLAKHADPSLDRMLNPPSPPPDLTPTTYPIGRGITLVGYNLRPDTNRRMNISLAWQTHRDVKNDLRFGIESGETRWGPFYFARGAFPTNVWKPGAFYLDELDIAVPQGGNFNPEAWRIVLLE